MRLQLILFLTGLALPTLGFALPSAEPELPLHLRGKRSFVEREGVNRTIFEHEATGATIDFVTNSGICETTAGVNQYSGYLSVGSKSCHLLFNLLTYPILQPTKTCGFGFSKHEIIQPRPLLRPGSTVDQDAPQ